MHIVEATLRQTWQRLFGPEITAFLVDDQWPSLLFVPDLDASRPTPASPPQRQRRLARRRNRGGAGGLKPPRQRGGRANPLTSGSPGPASR
jgi:hypothetical protein